MAAGASGRTAQRSAAPAHCPQQCLAAAACDVLAKGGPARTWSGVQPDHQQMRLSVGALELGTLLVR